MPNGVFKDAPVPMEVEGDNKSDALSDSIEKIVISCEGRKDSRTSELDFGVVDGELLALLCGLLQEHVCSAAQVDLVKEACHAIETQSQQNENKDSKGTRMTIEKVCSRGIMSNMKNVCRQNTFVATFCTFCSLLALH